MNKQEPEVVRNVVVLFPPEMEREFIEINHVIQSRVPSKVVLSDSEEQKALPHMTIYQGKYPEKNIPKVLQKLGELTTRWQPFPVIFQGLSLSLGTVFFDALPNEKLRQLHEEVVRKLNGLREGRIIEEELAIPSITDAQKRMVYTYGHSVVMDTFTPHISLARPVDLARIGEAAALVPKNLRLGVQISALHFAERGPNGTCPGAIQSFPFTSA